MKSIKKFMLTFLSLAMVLVFTPMPTYADAQAVSGEISFIDMPDNWSTAALKDAVSNGLLKGYETPQGMEIRPAGNITRAELVTVVNRAFGAGEKASLTGVLDVKEGAWYAPEIAKALAMQTMSKAENMRPNDFVTRQEAFTILARAYRQTGGKAAELAKFSDAHKVAAYAVDSLGALIKKGYVSGSGEGLNPTGFMTRAEFAKVMSNLTAAYVNTTAVFSNDVKGGLMVNTAGAKVQNMKVTGDFVIADGVGEGDVYMENLSITGDLIVKAGGSNSIRLKNVQVGGKLVVNKVGGPVRIVVEGDTKLPSVQVITNAIIKANELSGGYLGAVSIEGEKAVSVNLAGQFKVVALKAKGLTLNATGTIDRLDVSEKAAVTGGADIKVINNNCGVTINVNGQEIEPKAVSPAKTGGGGSTAEEEELSDPVLTISGEDLVGDAIHINAMESVTKTIEYSVENRGARTVTAVSADHGKVALSSGVYNKDRDTVTLTAVSDTPVSGSAPVPVEVKIKCGAVEKTINVTVEGTGDAFSADKTKLLEANLQADVAYYDDGEIVKKEIAKVVNAMSGLHYRDWEVDSMSGFEAERAGQQTLNVSLTSKCMGGSVVPASVKVNVETPTDENLLASDKARLEAKDGYLNVAVDKGASTDDVKTAISEEINNREGIYKTWMVANMKGYAPDDVEELSKKQKLTVTLSSGGVTTEEIILWLEVKLTREQAQAALEEDAQKLQAANFSVNMQNSQSEYDLGVKIQKAVNMISGLYFKENKWNTSITGGFTAGSPGEQMVSVNLTKSLSVFTPAITKEVPITVRVTVAEKNQAEDRQAYVNKLDSDEAKIRIENLDVNATTADNKTAVEAKIAEKVNGVAGLNFTDWGVRITSGFKAGNTGEQTVKVDIYKENELIKDRSVKVTVVSE